MKCEEKDVLLAWHAKVIQYNAVEYIVHTRQNWGTASALIYYLANQENCKPVLATPVHDVLDIKASNELPSVFGLFSAHHVLLVCVGVSVGVSVCMLLEDYFQVSLLRSGQ